MQVALRGRVVLVAHVGLHGVGVELGDRRRAERVAQVVEAKPAQAGPLERRVVAPPQVVVVEVLALAGEDEIVVVGEVLALLELASASITAGIIGTERTRLPFGTFSRPPVKLRRTWSSPSTKSTSDQRSASSSPCRSPVNAATR